MALMSAGSGLGGLLAPLLVLLIAATDWRSGLVIIGIGFWVMGIPVAFVMRRRPEDHGMLPDGAPSSETLQSDGEGGQTSGAPRLSLLVGEADFSVKEALRTRTFWQFALAMGGQHIGHAFVGAPDPCHDQLRCSPNPPKDGV